MILGIGSDLCNIERIQKSLDRFGERFAARVFTETERAKAEGRPFTRAGTYAKRFAAKEAFSKAVGTGFKRGVFMKDIATDRIAGERRGERERGRRPARGGWGRRRPAGPEIYRPPLG
jgi:holo-[acyl-carrier-protein] synthase